MSNINTEQLFNEIRPKTIYEALMLSIETRSTSLDNKPKLTDFPPSFVETLSNIPLKSITDCYYGTVLLTSNSSYEIEKIMLDSVNCTVFLVYKAGMIFPTLKQREARWLVCCIKTGAWIVAKNELGSLKKANGNTLAWRTLDVVGIHSNSKTVNCPDGFDFKIARIK